MKLLILSGTSNEQPYSDFLIAQKETWDTAHYPGVETVFFRDGPEDSKFSNIFSFEGTKEPALAHWRHKRAIDAVWDMDWDIIFRTHASSYVDKRAAYQLAFTMPQHNLYGGWLLGAGLPEISWNGKLIKQECISGAGIFYSRDIADVLRKNLPAGINIEEDVLAGRILQSMGYGVTFINWDRVDLVSMDGYRPSYHYRLKTGDRNADINRMYELHKKIKSL